MKKISLGISGAGPRTAILATTLTMTLIGVVNAQSAEEQRQRDAAAARIAASYGVVLDTISVYADRNPRQVLDLPQNVTVIGRQELDERMVRDVQDLVRYEPGITVAKTTSGSPCSRSRDSHQRCFRSRGCHRQASAHGCWKRHEW